MLLVMVGFSVVVVGLFFATIAVYLASLTGSFTGSMGAGGQAFAGLLLEPLTALFRAGLTTTGGGFALVVGGGITIFVARE